MSRPFDLDPLFRAITTLPGVGPKTAPLFEKLLRGGKVIDVLHHKPIDFIDRRYSPALKDAPDGKVVTIEVRIEKHSPAPRRGLPTRVTANDGTGAIDIVFFNANKDWVLKQLPIGEVRIISGRIESYQGKKQMVHPDMMGLPEERAAIETVEPVYGLTASVTNKTVKKAIQGALGTVPKLPEWLDDAHKKKKQWPDWHKAIATLHDPADESYLTPAHPARERLAYDELLANQLALALVRLHQRKQNGRAWKPTGMLRQKILSTLPFDLTGAQ